MCILPWSEVPQTGAAECVQTGKELVENMLVHHPTPQYSERRTLGLV